MFKRGFSVISILFSILTFIQVTAKGDAFLLHDSGAGDSDRLFIFATQQNLKCLAEATAWFADGTFKVTPGQFYQLYTVHAATNGIVVPMAYGLLPNKSEAKGNY